MGNPGLLGVEMSLAGGTDQEFQQALMEKGVFPESAPPTFRVQNFYDTCNALGLLSRDQINRNKPTRLSHYNETKRGNQRRLFSTPNPLFFIDAASYFNRHRQEFDQLMARSPYSRSTPLFNTDHSRFVRIESHADFTRHRRNILSSSRYIVKIDVSRFYPSIYTHSIAWAVHGKQQSKSDRVTQSAKTFANKLDYIVRQAQDQQTIGIPVGPDTSRIISELVACAVDLEFTVQVNPSVVGARLVDDVYLGAASVDDAENLLSAYRNSLRQYELDINESKTSIFEARYDLEPFWPVSIRRELERFSNGNNGSEQSRDLTSYLDEVIRIANQENDDGIIKYAIRKMDQQELWSIFWDTIEPFLIRCSIFFPHCFAYVARVVVWYNRRFDLNSVKWRNVCETVIGNHAKLGNDSEVAWSCWVLKELQEPIPKELYNTIVGRCGPYAVLLALDLYSRGLVSGRVSKKVLYDRLGSQPMLGSDWLLSYEAERSFGFRLKSKNRNDYEIFGNLLDQGVKFYDTTADPVVFEDIEDIENVSKALEDMGGAYEEDGDETQVGNF